MGYQYAEIDFFDWDRKPGDLSKGPECEEIAALLKLLDHHRVELPETWLAVPSSDD